MSSYRFGFLYVAFLGSLIGIVAAFISLLVFIIDDTVDFYTEIVSFFTLIILCSYIIILLICLINLIIFYFFTGGFYNILTSIFSGCIFGSLFCLSASLIIYSFYNNSILFIIGCVLLTLIIIIECILKFM